MTTFVLVPGGWKGAWVYDGVAPLLERAGHTVHALTLSGLGADDDRATAAINLDTHVDDVLRVFDRDGLTDVTLVGHSYGGMVITVAADRARGRVSRLVYLDAFVPRDGESWWSETNEFFRELISAGAADTGNTVQPTLGGDPRRRPHPLATFFQRVRLTGEVDRVARREFVYCAGWEDRTPFAAQRARLAADPGWLVHDLPTGHDAMGEDPEAVAAILLAEGENPLGRAVIQSTAPSPHRALA
ncbi:alpha/beta fold hydrolase [Nocardia sp. ET3-3]|uniref:Alpha/beta fold hydrolase n=1 Tax=Nocardia terrae TaxID=2675851 RepID=A0A7K1UNC6_9NOCA|nr:alpha/beta fold hydrolase [Nocardia terrae]MVU75842.1 alpha/beta fold hydrolase [Nocardia terrae]